ncbi:hypothetical protein FKM82_001197 [Ascaphus truei]
MPPPSLPHPPVDGRWSRRDVAQDKPLTRKSTEKDPIAIWFVKQNEELHSSWLPADQVCLNSGSSETRSLERIRVTVAPKPCLTV